MTDDWLENVAANAVKADEDRGGAPMGWLSQVERNRLEVIAEYGQVAWNKAYAAAKARSDQSQPAPRSNSANT